MPISLKQLNRLQNFKKHSCENCGCEFYSSRKSRWCNQSCKQAGYRERLLNDKEDEKINEIGFKIMKELPVTNLNEKPEKPFVKCEDNSEQVLEAARKRLKSIN